MIMPDPETYETDVRDRRLAQGWSQDELARRAGLSRAGVSAIEIGRLVPSVASALALAQALGCRVEELFHLKPPSTTVAPTWAWPHHSSSCRFWQAQVGDQRLIYPAEALAQGTIPHDGLFRNGVFQYQTQFDPHRTLVMACCDPAVGLLAQELARLENIRLIAFQRSSRKALELLSQGLVHVAGLHLSGPESAESNAAIVSQQIGPGFSLVHVALWESGIAFHPHLSLPSNTQALRNHVRWVGREEGSGARACMKEVLEGVIPTSLMAGDHRGVALAVGNHWADAGISLRLTSEEARLNFKTVRQESYDLCFPKSLEADIRIISLIKVLRSLQFRRLLGELPGYNSSGTGGISDN